VGLLARRRERLAVAVAAEITKASMAGNLPAGTSATIVNAQPTQGQPNNESGGPPSVPMPRPAETFGAVLSPGTPLLPAPLDRVDPATGRAAPRRWEAPVSWNLDLTTRRTPWQVLKALADQCDIIHRCIEIRCAEVTGLDWDFTLSDHAVSQIMADQNVGHAKAAALGRDKYGAEIDRLKEFFEQPAVGYTFAEWMGEILWNHYVFDAVAVYPECNLAGQVTSLMVVDGSTIKPLLDNRGMRPRSPAPAYQQILWGFPRGEWSETDPDMVDGEFQPTGQGRISDQLGYFVRNRRTWDPYGFSTVEECIPAATLYLGRQRWLVAEYSEGSTPETWMRSDLQAEGNNGPAALAAYERVLNDMLSGNTGERKRIKLLPAGFVPEQMKQIDERYKQEYDEFVIKQVGSKFGVAPTQLGIIPRTGLGGRGQQQGEQDQAETMSRTPTEEWLVDVLNQLCRRFLGSTRQITVTFNGGQSSADALNDAKTSQVKLSSGQTTLNDVAGELGRPLYDMPEADEPMIITATGPVFLRGTLDAQMNPPAPPAPIHVLPGDPKADPSPPDDSEPAGPSEDGTPSTAQKSAELAAWRRFTTKSPTRARPFEWHHHTADEIAHITKAADLPKGDGRPGPGGPLEQQLIDTYQPILAAALAELFDPERIAGYLITHPGSAAKAVSPDDLEAITGWLRHHTPRTARLLKAVKDLAGDSFVAGTKTGSDDLTGAGVNVPEAVAEVALIIEWGEWTPGVPEVAAKLAADGGAGWAQLLDRAEITIQGVTDAVMQRLAYAIAEAVDRGDSVQTLARTLGTILDDPAKALQVATTEINRAITDATLDTYRQAGVDGWNLLTAAGACPECLAIEAANPHPMSDQVDAPPVHPSCRCAVSPVVTLS
jgi:hypothetical protein